MNSINPDDIAATLEGSYEDRVRAAQTIADDRREKCIAARQNFAFETVMSHASKIDIMRRARYAGFHVTLFFVGTSYPQINIDRVGNRVELGGHSVPEDRIVARYYRTMEALMDAALTANRTVVFDNSRGDEEGGIRSFVEIRFEECDERKIDSIRERSTCIVNLSLEDESIPLWIRTYLLGKLHRRFNSELLHCLIVDVFGIDVED